jgi:hypothetical protein
MHAQLQHAQHFACTSSEITDSPSRRKASAQKLNKTTPSFKPGRDCAATINSWQCQETHAAQRGSDEQLSSSAADSHSRKHHQTALNPYSAIKQRKHAGKAAAALNKHTHSLQNTAILHVAACTAVTVAGLLQGTKASTEPGTNPNPKAIKVRRT